MCYCWFTLGAQDLHVKVSKAICYRGCHLEHSRNVDRVLAQIVKEGTSFVVISDEPQLCPSAVVCQASKIRLVLAMTTNISALSTFIVGSNESENAIIAQHHSLVNLNFTEPGLLVSRGENLHRNRLSPPSSLPHLTKSALSNDFQELNLSSDTSLYQEGKSWLKGKQ